MDDAAPQLVEQVVLRNTDDDRLPTISRRRIAETLEGSGFSSTDIDHALTTLSRRGAIVECSGGYRTAE